ncbi:DUF4198 domain-containing protein [Sulfurospirillum sp. T05]|uniref:DUF4198 domain-containing protein n=1 Tax=Sulfurospirillum tamanense TaxID=2813362 RepID=A0ABS2WUQ7_9BACT|nr:DUF4198 domain-containing protein [Sulfurospirillum tamanensis]MBN2965108.1 DUF4198 domain-containing protein [Sulfurospirillum tamanensis]
MKKLLSAVCVASLSLSSLMAHALWVEKEGDATKVFFGDWDKDSKELTGKRLDNIKAKTVLPQGVGTEASREYDHIFIQTKHAGDVAVVEPIAPRKSRLADTVGRTLYMGRAGRSENKALLPLDLVPVAPHSNEFTLMLEGEPLPRASVTLWGPPKWSIALRSDDAGKVTFKTPWKGEYLAQVRHVDESKGEVDGVAYDQTTYAMSLNFSVEKGIGWGNTTDDCAKQ